MANVEGPDEEEEEPLDEMAAAVEEAIAEEEEAIVAEEEVCRQRNSSRALGGPTRDNCLVRVKFV